MLRYGMDHDLYPYSMLQQRPKFLWPGQKTVALWICVAVQHFPLNQQGKPFKVPGGMSTPYPDLRHASLRDYGNRVGIYRVLDALASHQCNASFAINAALVEQLPKLVSELSKTGEILCHGMHMDALHAGAIETEIERVMIDKPSQILREFTGQPVLGWLSPAKSQTSNTPELLRAAGYQFYADWINDELPYQHQTSLGPITALPLCTELEDRFVLMQNQHSEQSWCQQVCDAFDFLAAEASREQSARMLALHIHPWLLGQPHRIGFLEQALAHFGKSKQLFSAQPSQIIAHWQNATKLP